MLGTLTTLMMLTAAGTPHGGPAARPILANMSHGAVNATPGIRIWTDGDNDVVKRGDRVRVYYRTERDAYVTIFRVDTDGHVHLVFPRTPDEENYGYGGATYTVSSAGNGAAFYVDDYDGVGYLFGIASSAPFNYDGLFNDGRWDLHAISDGRVHGDPLTSLEEIALHLLPEGFGDYDTHLLPYYVEQRYSYPRFVCYDCHAYVPYTSWDPYQAWCRRYQLVIWNDPFYYYPSSWYPTRYYGGTRVVYSSPGGSRYVFKTRDNSAPGVDYRDRRTTRLASAGGSRPADRGVRGTDLGGVGTVAVPVGSGRRYAPPTAGSTEQPRDPQMPGHDVAPGAVGEGGRRRDAGGLTETPPPAVPMEGGRRSTIPVGEARPSPTTIPADMGRRTTSPGIEIVPRQPESRPEAPGRQTPDAAQTPARRTPDAVQIPNNEPVLRQAEPRNTTEGQTRPSRPEITSRPAPETRQTTPRQPEAAPESRPRETPRAPEARPQAPPPPPPAPRPQSAPRAPESRPQSAPRAPESRPQSAPQHSSGSQGHSGGSSGGMVRRRP
ncbi:MAG TPA: DUF4384 domain-containing protein [Gemmatimonadales bacterium]|jgi:hypothetical protein